MEGLFSLKSFDKKKEMDIDLSNQPELLEQARQYYLTMSGPHTSTRGYQNSKTPTPSRPSQMKRSNQPQASDQQYFSDNLTTNSQPEDQLNEPTEKNLDESLRLSSGRPSSGRRLRSERTRGKTPTATQIAASKEPVRDQNSLKSSYQGIQTMDDFANMLLAKHESNRQQCLPTQVQVYQPEIRTNNLFAKVPYIVTVNDEDQSLPELVSQVQMLDNSTLPLDDSDLNQSPRRDQIKPYIKLSPQKAHHETSLEFAVQKIQVIEDVSQEDSSYYEQVNAQETRKEEVVDCAKRNYGYLTSIKEFNESEENMITEQTTSPSHQVEYISLRCDENEHLMDRQDDSALKEPIQQQLTQKSNDTEMQGHCEENFGSQSPIKKFQLEENQTVRNASTKSPSELASPDKADDQNLNQTSEDLAQGLSNQMLREENEQLQAQFEQLSTQLIQAQSTIGSLERQISAKDIQHMQDQLRYEQLCQQIEMQNTQHELHVTQLIESNTLATHKLHHDFEVKKQQQIEEQEKVVAYLRAALAHSQEQSKHFETQVKQREQVTVKLRQDNQNMFADLKQLAQSEQHLKFELDDARSVIQELESHSQQLTDSLKQQNQQFSEQMKNQQAQMEIIKQQTNKSIKDTIQESDRQQKESQQREQQLMQEIQSLLEQNQLLASKSQSLEQERLNITTERERKNNELRQMHQELQKMTTVINGMKQMQVSSFDTNVSGPYFGQRGSSTGKVANSVMVNHPQMNHQRQVLHQADLNMEWTNQYQQQHQQTEVRPQSPFKKVSVTPHPVSSPSPLKGRMDPNMAQYARRQNLNITNQQQDFESIVQEMTLQEMQGTKSKMEAEYARIPIILTGKSLQIRKRKEELEYELDLIEKYINRAKQNRL